MMYGRNGKSISSAPVSTIAIGRFMWSIPGMFPQSFLRIRKWRSPFITAGCGKGCRGDYSKECRKVWREECKRDWREAVPRKRNRWPATWNGWGWIPRPFRGLQVLRGMLLTDCDGVQLHTRRADMLKLYKKWWLSFRNARAGLFLLEIHLNL